MKKIVPYLFVLAVSSCFDFPIWELFGMEAPNIIRLQGIPVYFDMEWDALYRDYKGGGAQSFFSDTQTIVDLYWNDSILIVKNDTSMYYVFNIAVPDTVGLGWNLYGCWEEQEFKRNKHNYGIDEKNMKHLYFLPYWIWRNEHDRVRKPHKWKGMEEGILNYKRNTN